MKLALIGVGQAGGKIVDAFIEYEAQTNQDLFDTPIAVNTASADLKGLENVPEEHRILIGQTRVNGHGVGADNELGAEIAELDIDEIQTAVDDVSVYDVDAFLIVASMGGGTGSGGAPVIAKHLKHVYTEPVFGLGVLPAKDEGGIYTLNAARSFQTFVREVDNLLVFDNDAWRQTGESMQSSYETINREIVSRFGVLFGAGETSGGDAVGQSVVDSSEIINTLDGGGVSTIGYASESIQTTPDQGLISRFTSSTEEEKDSAETTNLVTSLVRKATMGRLTLPCDIDGAERVLLVLSGPPRSLNRKGIEKGRKWLEQETGSMEVRGGDYPLPAADSVASAVLLSGVHEVPRIKELQQVAIDAQEKIECQRDESEQQFQQLIHEGTEELSPLY